MAQVGPAPMDEDLETGDALPNIPKAIENFQVKENNVLVEPEIEKAESIAAVSASGSAKDDAAEEEEDMVAEMAPPPGLRSVKRRGTLTATELARSKSETSEQMEEELFTEEEWDKKKWLTYNFLQITTCIAAGVVFGVAAEKSRVFEPSSIRKQMIFRRWIMLKFFLGALCTGQLCISLMSILPWTKYHFKEATYNYLNSYKGKGILSTVIGALILGVGMTVSGACPGMVLVQIGTGTQNAWFTFLGVLVGTLVYGLVEPWCVKWTAPKVSLSIQPPLIYEKLGISYATLAIPMCLGITAALFLMEWFIPWTGDLDLEDVNKPGVSIVAATSWPPSVAGALVGTLQVVLVLGMGKTVGGSSGYVTLVAQWVVSDKLKQKFQYLANAREGFVRNWWMVVYNVGIIIGALFSSMSSLTTGLASEVPVIAALVGGFLLLFGARFSSGCTSGHGISGVTMLGWLSCFSIPCMFGGAIIAAFIMYFLGAL